MGEGKPFFPCTAISIEKYKYDTSLPYNHANDAKPFSRFHAFLAASS